MTHWARLLEALGVTPATFDLEHQAKFDLSPDGWLTLLVCGAVYEACCVGFVHHAEAEQAGRTALFSMLAGAAAATGILDSVAHWYLAFALVLGYGAGSWGAVEWKRARSTKTGGV